MKKSEDTEEKEPIKVAFSLPQITGGALAAATAAALGAQLGVAGTIVGAAVASVIGGVAGTLYSAGIDRTHRKVTEAIQRGYERVRHENDAAAEATQVLPTGDAAVTQVLPGLGAGTEIFRPTVDATAPLSAADRTRADLEPIGGAGAGRRNDSRKRVWKVMGLTAGAMFVLALVVVTALELGLGRALDGSTGTTVSQVVRNRPAASTSAKPKPTPSRTTATPTPSVTPTTPTPTPSESVLPTPTPSITVTETAPQTPAPVATES